MRTNRNATPLSAPTPTIARNEISAGGQPPHEKTVRRFSQGKTAAAAQALLGWFKVHRRDLPWRETYHPYEVWVSEMMLQQTQVATVVPYFRRWMAQFPTVADVAAAPLEKVLKGWEGLGYYSRARALHRAAREVVARFGGVFPETVGELRTLPGIGPYSAGAIAGIAFNRPAVALDGNAARVLARLFACPLHPTSPAGRRTLTGLAERLLPPGKAREFNQALMELGALVCRASRADCEVCPLRPHCRATRRGSPLAFPAAKPRLQRRVVQGVMALVADGDSLLVCQRLPDGLWGGLWEFPWLESQPGESTAETLERLLGNFPSAKGAHSHPLGSIRHGLTHLQLELACQTVLLPGGRSRPETLRGGRSRWASLEAIRALPLGKPNHKALALLKKRADDQGDNQFFENP